MPAAPASRAVVRESSSFLGTRTITMALPSEWVCAAWTALPLSISTSNLQTHVFDLLVQLKPVEHTVLDIYPDKVWFCLCKQLGHEYAGDAVSDTEQCLCRIGHGIFQCLTKVAGVCEHSRAVGRGSVQVRLLAVGFVFGHVGGVVLVPGSKGSI